MPAGSEEISLKHRILAFTLLWFLAAGVAAIFAPGPVEAGPAESEFLGRLQLFCLTPLLAAMGVAITLIGDEGIPWQQRDHARLLVFGCVLLFFVVHALVTLSRRQRIPFFSCLTIQAAFLVAGIACVLHLLQREALGGG